MGWRNKSEHETAQMMAYAQKHAGSLSTQEQQLGDVAYTQAQESIPPPPVILDSNEQLLDYQKPKFFGYTAAVFAFFFGLVILVLLTIGAGGEGFLLGIILWIVVMLLIRARFWRRTGYWFTSDRIVIHDGVKVMLIPYHEIALSSVTFEKNSMTFSTIYNKEFAIQGVTDIDELVRFLTSQVELSKKAKGY